MSKSKDNKVSLELERFEKKIKEYQDYLEKNNILKISDEGDRYKEISAQNSIMDKLPSWLKGLKELRENAEEKTPSTYGDAEIPMAYKLKGKE